MMRLTHDRVAASRILALGVLLAALMASLMLAAGEARASTTFTVTNTNDSGTGSLRQAILDANTTTGADNIDFIIPGTGVKTIAPDSELPNITDEVTINGYTQAGASPNTLAVGDNAVLKIELSGASVPGGYGLRIGAANSTVKGLIINRWYGGVRMGGNDAKGNKVEGNYIGTDPSGQMDMGNDTSGVSIVDAPNNVVGGTTAAARNVIAFNGEAGVYVIGQSATGNRVLSNSIFSTFGLGIDLGGDGPTANDPGDADTGPNNLQNKPRVTSAKTGGDKTTVSARLSSTPNRTFTVQFFSNPAGTDEGKKFLGQKSVITDSSGNVSFAFSPAQKVGLGRIITATATSAAGNTSEFSAPRTVVAR